MRLLLALPLFCLGLASSQTVDSSLSFFITSTNPGKGANLGGLAGADAHCLKLAQAAGSTKKNWRAYLSTQGANAENAKDRIGKGPWFNARKVQVAAGVADLHSANNKLSKANSLTEAGAVVNGRGDSPNRHDILTGSNLDGTAFPAGTDHTCSNWTSEADGVGGAEVGHHDRDGGGANPTSWNSAHVSRGCSNANLAGSGGAGFFYCFEAGETPSGLRLRDALPPGPRLAMALGTGRSSDRMVRFGLPTPGTVSVKVYGPQGDEVATLFQGRLGAGAHVLDWDGRDASGKALPAGAYWARVLRENRAE